MMGLASLAFIAVFREGVETVFFMAGLTANIGTDVVMGAAVGLLLAAFLGYGLFAASWKINLRRFFQGTGLFLIIVAAGLFADFFAFLAVAIVLLPLSRCGTHCAVHSEAGRPVTGDSGSIGGNYSAIQGEGNPSHTLFSL